MKRNILREFIVRNIFHDAFTVFLLLINTELSEDFVLVITCLADAVNEFL